ncbi:unnamed protein product [Didymodactylos carnosus]|uniref:Uncharacterized protein n=1 Tax=Didymodactylos carnosus TaxID=1234261 RepID=A0A814SFZ4_9BILA|nr:unnamed protein product [Didymodactylos carnosus]CAF1145928.1 unnamed protein product [Didymodactylos carnosus]CAF3743656.1 unnamed protein product [Didymodactylos carnosus]CAF3909523.1 unnamed protein product [Didymodactylos carnosus]
MNEYNLAIEYLTGLKLTDNSLSNAWIYSSTGDCYEKQQLYNHAIDYYMKSLTMIEKILQNNDSLSCLETELGRLNNCIGLCYDRNGQSNTLVLNYYKKSLEYYKNCDNFENCIIVYKNIAIFCSKKNDYHLSIEYVRMCQIQKI